ncbi:MAG: S1/P1 nuclease, partial [Acidobacteriota bacterium]|nr:S1/P1 nuclease [Acidobacteriota bacterium]
HRRPRSKRFDLIVKDPVLISQKHLPSDRGANQLIIDNDRKRLHSFWDFDLVTSLMLATGEQTSDTLGLYLEQTIKPKSNWNPHGAVSTWAAQWATDSLHLAREQTYKSVNIIRERTITVLTRDRQPVMRDGQPVTEIVYDVTRANNYETLNRELVRQQLAKAGFRLAKLLDAIYSSN